MMAQSTGTTLDELLEFIRDSRGFDFTGYKRSSIERRVTKRMHELQLKSYDEYLDHLQLNGDEFVELFDTLLINVTGFFRDPQTWEYLASTVLPELLASRPANAPFRVWSAGCASGEEAYTIAMVLARVMGDAEFSSRVKVYATDIDERALDRARQGTYTPRQVEDVPREALERFFDGTNQRYVFRKDLRRSVIFGRNDLIQDAPISRIDLLICRNTLMYFTAEIQSQILRRFHFGLDNEGALVLGKSEMLITHADLFTPVDHKWRIFRKVVRPAMRERLRVLTGEAGNGAAHDLGDNLREAAFNVSGVAQVVLDSGGSLVMANESARRMFGLGVADFGRPVQDLELSYRPVELRSHLDHMTRDMRSVDITQVRWAGMDRERLLDIRVAPLVADGMLMGTSISYVDVTESSELQDQLAASKRSLEQVYEELQSTVEELETTNEELQSTNEELETTNEELQSTNEELETMNEELQSSNEELETMNDELRHRTLELNDINSFLETILTAMGLAVAVIDRGQHVRIWNEQARELWGLSAEEIEDRHFLGLEFGLAVERLKPQLLRILSAQSEREEAVLDAVNRRGKSLQCRVSILPLGTSAGDGAVSGATIIMEPVDD
jgi:two-component system, chemotaxis family, CheB/CheR fusion protein